MKNNILKISAIGLIMLSSILSSNIVFAQSNGSKQIIFERYDGKKLNQSCISKVLSKSLNNIQNNENAYAYKINLNENHPKVIDMQKNQSIVKFFSPNEPEKVLYGLMDEYNVYIYKNGNLWSMWEVLNIKPLQDCRS